MLHGNVEMMMLYRHIVCAKEMDQCEYFLI